MSTEIIDGNLPPDLKVEVDGNLPPDLKKVEVEVMEPADFEDFESASRGVTGDYCEVGNNCGRAGCPECQQ